VALSSFLTRYTSQSVCQVIRRCGKFLGPAQCGSPSKEKKQCGEAVKAELVGGIPWGRLRESGRVWGVQVLGALLEVVGRSAEHSGAALSI
jgi:hypothetical protein